MDTQTPPTNDVLFSPLTETIHGGNCVAIIGAGVSAGDYPLWNELISILRESCEVRPEELQSNDPLDVAEAAKGKGKDYYDLLDEKFGRKDNPQTLYRYHMLARIKFASYITLNFDPLLLDTLNLHRNVKVSEYPVLKNQYHGERELFYLHGRLGPDRPAAKTKIVLTRTEFEEAYDPFKGRLHAFLQSTFLDYNVCFIGCNPEEENMRHLLKECEKCCENLHGLQDGNRPKRFLLWDGNSEPPETLTKYCGIEVVRYPNIDTKFSGLDQILKCWAKQEEPLYRSAGVDKSLYQADVEPEQ